MTEAETAQREHGRALIRERGVCSPRAPDYVVALDEAGAALRHRDALLLVDTLPAADIEAAVRPRAPGEDEDWLNRLTHADGVSSMDEQRALARQMLGGSSRARLPWSGAGEHASPGQVERRRAGVNEGELV